MKKILYIVMLASGSAAAQNNINQPNQENNINNPVQVNNGNGTVQNDDWHPFQGNKFDKHHSSENNNDNEDVQKQGKDGKPYCKECEEIKKLKQQHMQEHYSSDAYGQKKRNHYVKRFCFCTQKKVKKAFGRNKKVKPNYSCFNW